ncbi:MAG: N-acetyl-gamma-glutamyl-phosphate reductase [Candidatus Omnitrophica bacterium]|nr:N-acetyl-gamma-glutamyl-phosphate reductase [Candidatus Omnitrophota bacterium]
MNIQAGIIGVTGYAGSELLRILLRHEGISVRYLGSRRLLSPKPLGELLPSFRGTSALVVRPFRLKEALEACDVLFLALPHGTAMKLVPQIFRKKSIKVVDFSGDFRLASKASFRKAYHLGHCASALLKEAVYGLPEWNREAIRSARLVANPGCYPTAALLALAPLAVAGLLASEGLVVDAKSGLTGAGRSLREDLLFSEVNEDVRAYRVNQHQHMPEMEQELRRMNGRKVQLTFVPHLVPLDRGLYATVYAPLTKALTEKGLRSLYRRAYEKEPFIQLLPEEAWPQAKSVAGSNRCEIGLRLAPGGKRVILLSAIDNLGKGAAGQAVQNMNLLFDLEETQGLLP